MALTFLKGFQSPVEMGRHGVGFTLTPALDPVRQAPSTDPVEIQRTTDSAGAPNVGAAVTIADKLFVPAAGLMYVDERSSTNDVWWYRYRHVSTGGVASNWTAWVPARSELIVPDLRTAGVVQLPLIARESLGTSIVADIGSLGRFDLVLNGDFEAGLAYWGSTTPAAISMETAAPDKGTNSLKIAHTAAAVETVYQDDNTLDDASGDPLLIRVQPDSALWVTASGKLSAASGLALAVIMDKYDDAGGFISSITALTWTSETAFTLKFARTPIGALTYYVVLRFEMSGASSGTGWFDELHAWKNPEMPWLAKQGIPSAPSFSFHRDEDTGINNPGANELDQVVGGVVHTHLSTLHFSLPTKSNAVIGGRIDHRADNVSHSGNTTETQLYGTVVDAATITAANAGIRVRGRAIIGPSSSGATEFKLKFGTIPLFVFASPDSSQREIHFDVTLLRTGLATAELSASEVRRFNAGVFETIIPVTGTPAPTWANANTLETTAQMGAAGSGVITMENWVVEYIG